MAHSIETPQLLQTEIEDGRKVDHLVEIKETSGQDPSGSQTNKSANQIFDEMFVDLDKSSIKSCTISRVAVVLRETNPDAYTPKIVSIGPYHRKNPQLAPMKKYKLLYLRRFLQRKEGLDVKSCISQLEELKEEAIKCYEDIEDTTGDQFLQMLLLDGCFVIELIRELFVDQVQGEDKIINVGCLVAKIGRDLLLLENQLPFFVLTKIHNMTNQASEIKEFIWTLQIAFLAKLSDMNRAFFQDFTFRCDEGNIKHLLHILHMSWHRNPSDDAEQSIHMRKSLYCCNPLQILIKSKEEPKDTDDMIWPPRDHDKVLPNATELSEAGVSFTKVGGINYREGRSLLFDIKFKNGVMTIPCFQVVDDTESLLRNLIAYEQHSVDIQLRYFSDFAVFMDYLIDSDKDVSLLRKNRIIVNWMGDDKEVATFFNRIGKGVIVSMDNFYYKEVCKKAVQHCKKPWNRMMANLKHNYFSSPWVGASTVAAIILLLLTAIQTILAFTGGIK